VRAAGCCSCVSYALCAHHLDVTFRSGKPSYGGRSGACRAKHRARIVQRMDRLSTRVFLFGSLAVVCLASTEKAGAQCSPGSELPGGACAERTLDAGLRFDAGEACPRGTRRQRNGQLCVSIQRSRERAIETLEGRCESGDPAACVRLVAHHEQGCRPQTERAATHCLKAARLSDGMHAFTFRTLACHRGNQEGCAELAAHLIEHRDPVIVEHGATLARGACAARIGMGCNVLGVYVARQAPRDASAVRDAFRRACELDDVSGCANYGLFFEMPMPTPDFPRAADIYRRACNARQTKSCVALGRMIASGVVPPAAGERALELLERGCSDTDPSECATLALVLASTPPAVPAPRVAQDLGRARRLAEPLCSESSVTGCFALGVIELREGGAPEPPLRRACSSGDDRACSELGILHFRGVQARPEPAPDLPVALSYLRPSCEQGNLMSCLWMGFHDLDYRNENRDVEAGVELLERACRGGIQAACASLGATLLSGMRGIPRDPARALGLLQRSCEAGALWGCYHLGLAAQHGVGVSADLIRARELYQQACDGGELAACQALADALLSERGDNEAEATRAASLLERACGGHVAPACTQLSWLRAASPFARLRNEQDGRRLLSRGCDLGDTTACWEVALREQREAGATHIRPEVAMSLTRATAEFLDQCDAGIAAGCRSAGHAYETGFGGAVDITVVQHFYRLACDAGDTLGCAKLGRALLMGQNPPTLAVNQARQLLDRTCEVNIPEACSARAFLHQLDGNPEAALDLYSRACNAGFPSACFDWAKLVLQRQGSVRSERSGAIATLDRLCRLFGGTPCTDFAVAEMQERTGPVSQRAVTLLTAQCRNNDARACDEVGRAIELGRVQGVTRGSALTWYEGGCSGGFPPACYHLGEALRRSATTPLDRARSLVLRAQACANGVMEACSVVEAPHDPL
jgi:TPR repeat protein